MKQARRQELKTNDLSVYLQQTSEWAQANATYLIGGAVVVVLILVSVLWVQYSRRAAREKGWRDYYSIKSENAAQDPSAIDRAKTLAAEYGSDPELGAMTLTLQGDLLYQRALSLTSPMDRGQRLELLANAKETYEQLIGKYAQQPLVVAGAKMSLASVMETLLMAGQGNIEEIRGLYQQLIDGPTNSFQRSAKELQANLVERTKKLDIVPPPPPATAPASAPAITMRARPPTTATAPAFSVPLKVTPVPRAKATAPAK